MLDYRCLRGQSCTQPREAQTGQTGSFILILVCALLLFGRILVDLIWR